MSHVVEKGPPPKRSSTFLRREWPYLAMLVLAFGGIAITNLSPLATATHWQVLTVFFGIICVVTEWRRLTDPGQRWRLVWSQVLHWATLLVAMRMLLASGVQKTLSANEIGLEVLGLLALGTILAAIHAASWEIGIVGIVLAVAIPAIAWLEQAALLMVLAGIVATTIIAVVVWYRYR
jgi:hypothetical protein